MIITKKLDSQIERHKYLIKIIKDKFPNKEINIIDIGCGQANLAKLLRAEGYEKIVGIDKLELNKVKNIDYLQKYHNLDIELENFITDKKFDLIICSEVIEHLNNTQKILKLMKNLLNDNGIIILTVPNNSNIFSRFYFCWKGMLKRYPVEKKNSYSHITIILKENLMSFLNRIDMKIVQILGGKIFFKNFCIFPNKYFSYFWSYDVVYIIKKNS